MHSFFYQHLNVLLKKATFRTKAEFVQSCSDQWSNTGVNRVHQHLNASVDSSSWIHISFSNIRHIWFICCL